MFGLGRYLLQDSSTTAGRIELANTMELVDDGLPPKTRINNTLITLKVGEFFLESSTTTDRNNPNFNPSQAAPANTNPVEIRYRTAATGTDSYLDFVLTDQERRVIPKSTNLFNPGDIIVLISTEHGFEFLRNLTDDTVQENIVEYTPDDEFYENSHGVQSAIRFESIIDRAASEATVTHATPSGLVLDVDVLMQNRESYHIINVQVVLNGAGGIEHKAVYKQGNAFNPYGSIVYRLGWEGNYLGQNDIEFIPKTKSRLTFELQSHDVSDRTGLGRLIAVKPASEVLHDSIGVKDPNKWSFRQQRGTDALNGFDTLDETTPTHVMEVDIQSDRLFTDVSQAIVEGDDKKALSLEAGKSLLARINAITIAPNANNIVVENSLASTNCDAALAACKGKDLNDRLTTMEGLKGNIPTTPPEADRNKVWGTDAQGTFGWRSPTRASLSDDWSGAEENIGLNLRGAFNIAEKVKGRVYVAYSKSTETIVEDAENLVVDTIVFDLFSPETHEDRENFTYDPADTFLFRLSANTTPTNTAVNLQLGRTGPTRTYRTYLYSPPSDRDLRTIPASYWNHNTTYMAYVGGTTNSMGVATDVHYIPISNTC